jgi:hypothetical protein
MGVQHVMHPEVVVSHDSKQGLVEWSLIRAKGQGDCLERGGSMLMICRNKEMYLLIPKKNKNFFVVTLPSNVND